MEAPKFEKNLGTYIVKDFDNYYSQIREIMRPKYNVDNCDICSTIKVEASKHIVHIYFKFVHYSVRTMATEPYWLITLEKE